MDITPNVWTTIIGLKYDGVHVEKWNTSLIAECIKVWFFKNCLRRQDTSVRGFHVGGLKTD